MNTSLNDTQRQHQEIALLLPWFVNDSLESDEHSRVENHIRRCLVCRRQLIDLRRLADMVNQESNLDVAAETSFSRIADQLGKPASARYQQPAAAKHRDRSIKRYSRSSSFAYALAASLVLAALLPLGLQTMQRDDSDSFATLSAATTAVSNQTGELRVVFAKTASASDIAALLEALHGQPIGAANSVGALNIRLNHDGSSPTLEQAIALLRSRPEVVLAEPVVQP